MDSKKKKNIIEFYKNNLLAPKEFWEISEDKLNNIVNGCGPKGWKSLFVPNSIYKICIKVACNIHDYGYYYGKTKKDKLKADTEFLFNIITILNNSELKDDVLLKAHKIAIKYYEFVDKYGWEAFIVDELKIEEKEIVKKRIGIDWFSE